MREESTSVVVTCERCGTICRADANYCPTCGAPTRPSVPSLALEPPRPLEDDPKARRAWRELSSLITLYSVLLFLSLVYGWTAAIDDELLIEPFVLGFSTLVVSIYVARQWADLRELLAIRLPTLRAIVQTLVALVVFFVPLHLAFALLEILGVPFVSTTDDYVRLGWPTWAMVLSVAIVPPFYEELAFRGVLQGALERLSGRKEALLIQAALFSLLHLSPIIFVTHFLMGLVLGWIRYRVKSLYPCFLIHALWNGWVLFQELASG